MGYTTEFSGFINIEPPLNAEEIAFLRKFNETRRMDREKGPYFVGGTGFAGQGSDPDIISYNNPPAGQPSLWCNWVPTEGGEELEWDGGEKFYGSVEWMQYLIDHFLKPGALAASELPFLQANHICNGIIDAQGEAFDDHWSLIVENNVVRQVDAAAAAQEAQDTIKALRDALSALTDSAESVVASWESGDLAGAVNALEGDAEAARTVLAKVTP